MPTFGTEPLPTLEQSGGAGGLWSWFGGGGAKKKVTLLSLHSNCLDIICMKTPTLRRPNRQSAVTLNPNHKPVLEVVCGGGTDCITSPKP